MGKEYGAPLHARTHWRRTREVISEIAKYERFNVEDYDLFSMVAYDTIGQNQKGKNVSYNTHKGLSCWVLDNKYEIFEIPNLRNKKGSPYGNFLFFAYNSSFNYYVFGEMDVKLDGEETRRTKFVTENVHYEVYGKYDIVFTGRDNNITKQEYGAQFDPGMPSNEHTFTFDSFNERKKAFRTSAYKILKDLGVSNVAPNKVIGKGKVEIYKKNKPSSSKPKVNGIPKNKSNKNMAGSKPTSRKKF
jgi:hypothetical protein